MAQGTVCLAELGRVWARRRPPFRGLHLDSAAASRSSVETVQAASEHLCREAEVGAYVAEAEAGPVLAAGRKALGGLLGVPADGLAFRSGVTPRRRSGTSTPPPEPTSSTPPAASGWPARAVWGCSPSPNHGGTGYTCHQPAGSRRLVQVLARVPGWDILDAAGDVSRWSLMQSLSSTRPSRRHEGHGA